MPCFKTASPSVHSVLLASSKTHSVVQDYSNLQLLSIFSLFVLLPGTLPLFSKCINNHLLSLTVISIRLNLTAQDEALIFITNTQIILPLSNTYLSTCGFKNYSLFYLPDEVHQ